jgi:hypothetical protein
LGAGFINFLFVDQNFSRDDQSLSSFS